MRSALVIESDAALARQVVRHLGRAGLRSVWWRTGRLPDCGDLEELALILLDLTLPGIGGLDIVASVRARSDVPVLALSERHDGHDKVRALELGADDCVTKPFWPEELVARVRACLRRPTLQRSSQLRAGDVSIDPVTRRAQSGQRELSLTRVEFDLLVALIRRAGRPVSRGWLLDHVLDPEREASERTLDVHVSRLRKKLGDRSAIETVWGIGYRVRP